MKADLRKLLNQEQSDFMREEDVTELGVLYALGALDEAAAKEFADYLQSAPEALQHEVEEWREVVAQLPLALPSPPVPPHLKDQLFARINSDARSEGGSSALDASSSHTSSSEAAPDAHANIVAFSSRLRPALQSWRWLPLAAAVAFALLSGVLLWQNSRLTAERDQLARKLDSYVAELNQQRQELIARQQEISTITAPTTYIIPLSGEPQAPQASAKLVWDKVNNQWVIYFYNLPAAPSDKAYQLWYITKDSAKIPASVFKPNVQGHAEVRVSVPPDVAPRVALAAITLEPNGGSEQPTGPIYLKGTV